MERPKSNRLPSWHPYPLHLRITTSPGRPSKGPGKGNPKLKLLGAGALLVSAAAYDLVPTPGTANPITYTLAGASATFGALGTVTFTGTFTFDPSGPTGPTLDSIAVMASGPIPPLSVSPEAIDTPDSGKHIRVDRYSVHPTRPIRILIY